MFYGFVVCEGVCCCGCSLIISFTRKKERGLNSVWSYGRKAFNEYRVNDGEYKIKFDVYRVYFISFLNFVRQEVVMNVKAV